MSRFRVFHGFSAACIHLTGEDAWNYLCGQMTVSIPEPKLNKWIHGLWLNENGRVLADSFVYPQAGDSCLLWSFSCPRQVLIDTIQRNLVSDDVALTDMTDTLQFSVLHPFLSKGDGEIAKLLESVGMEIPDAFSIIESDQAILCGGSLFSPEDFVFIAVPAFHDSLQSALVSIDASFEVYDLKSETFAYARIDQGIAAIPQDLSSRNLPQEGGFPDSIIDFRKGCFPGQEIMAKFRKGGKLNKQLFAFALETAVDAEAFELPCEIMAENLAVGNMTSLATVKSQTIGLGLVRLRSLERTLHLKNRDGSKICLRPLHKKEGLSPAD